MTKSRRYVDVFPMIFPSPSASPHSNPYFFMLVWLWVKPLIPQVAGSWICVLSQSYGKFISFDPSPYSHRKAPSKSLGQMDPNSSSSLLPWMRSASDLRTLERSFAAAGNFGNWMEESWRVTMGKSWKIHRKPWCFTLNMGAAVCFAIIPMLGEWWEPWL